MLQHSKEHSEETLEVLVEGGFIGAPQEKPATLEQHPEIYGSPIIAPQAYLQAQKYPQEMEWIDGKPIIKRNKYLLGENLLGLCWTYSGIIEILEGLQGRDREKVVEHEKGHREFPMRSEEENRRKTYTEEPKINPVVSYLG